MNKDDVIRQITSELLEEIKRSNKTFTNEEVKEKINSKLDSFFNDEKIKEDSLKASLDEQDQILNDEFTKIDNDEDLLASNSAFIEDSDSDEDSTQKNEPKKKFFQEIADIYKAELQNSISCFKNTLEVFKLAKKTSLFETILIFIFLAIPAILAGSIAIIIVIILFLLWQIYLIIKSIFELLKKAEISIKGFNEAIKRKIKSFKNSGGFVNRLIFSNALYSLMMFNGIMYMLIKGLMLPLKSALDAEKILANLLAKLEKGLTTVLKAPSELALANTKTEAAKSRSAAEKQRDTKAKVRTTKRREKVVEKVQKVDREKAQVRNQQKSVKQDEALKALHQSRLEVANAIARNLRTETSQQTAQDVGGMAISLAERSDRQQTPMSSRLSLSSMLGERNDMMGQILNGVLTAMRDSFAKTVDGIDGLSQILGRQGPGNTTDPALASEIQKAQVGYQGQLNALKLQLTQSDNPIEVADLQTRITIVEENREGFNNRVSSGEIQTISDVREAQLSNEANDPREFVQRTVEDPELRGIMLGVISDAEEGRIGSEQMGTLLLGGITRHFQDKGMSEAEVQERVLELSSVVKSAVVEHREFEQQRGASREESSREEGFVDRLENRDNGESLSMGRE